MRCAICKRTLFALEEPIGVCYIDWQRGIDRFDDLMTLGRMGTIWR